LSPEPIAALRTVHLPYDGALNVGDFMLAVAVGFALALLVSETWAFMRKRRRPVRRKALDLLAASRSVAAEHRIVVQAKLLRQLVGLLSGDAAARRQGRAWLDQLDRTFQTDFFTRREGRHFGDDLYRSVAGPDVEVLDHELLVLIERIRS
jgi:hypothetical protein